MTEQNRTSVTLEQLALVLDTLDEVTDDIRSVAIGSESVSTRLDIRDWLRRLQQSDDFLHYVNGTGPYSDDRPRDVKPKVAVDAALLAEVKAFLRSGFDRNDRGDGIRLAAKLPDGAA